jgi:ankyrin repeat protein
LLQVFSAAGAEKIATILLENGANPNIKDKTGQDARDIAKFFGRSNIVDLLSRFLWINSGNFVESNFSDELFVRCQDGKVPIHGFCFISCPTLQQIGLLECGIV